MEENGRLITESILEQSEDDEDIDHIHKNIKENQSIDKSLRDKTNNLAEIKKTKVLKEITYDQILQEIKAETAELILKNVYLYIKKKNLLEKIYLERKKC